jgi:circadian clock protein KaiC
LEMHLLMMHKIIDKYKPDIVIVDPMTNLISVGTLMDVKAMLTRLIDHLKVNMITGFFTALANNINTSENTIEGISSLIDTLIQLRNIEINDELIRGLQIVKSRGMQHSNKIREFILNEEGIDLVELKITKND